MKHRRHAALVGMLMFTALAIAAAQSQLRPGRYETTADLNLGGLPTEPMKDDRCILAGEAKEFPLQVMRSPTEKPCKVSEVTTSANKVTFNTTCNPDADGVRYTSTSEVTFTSDSFKGVTRTKSTNGQVNIVTIVGTRVGGCSY